MSAHNNSEMEPKDNVNKWKLQTVDNNKDNCKEMETQPPKPPRVVVVNSEQKTPQSRVDNEVETKPPPRVKADDGELGAKADDDDGEIKASVTVDDGETKAKKINDDGENADVKKKPQSNTVKKRRYNNYTIDDAELIMEKNVADPKETTESNNDNSDAPWITVKSKKSKKKQKSWAEDWDECEEYKNDLPYEEKVTNYENDVYGFEGREFEMWTEKFNVLNQKVDDLINYIKMPMSNKTNNAPNNNVRNYNQNAPNNNNSARNYNQNKTKTNNALNDDDDDNNSARNYNRVNNDNNTRKKNVDKARVDIDFSTLTCNIHGDKSKYGFVCGYKQSNVKYLLNHSNVQVKVPTRDQESNKIEMICNSNEIGDLTFAVKRVIEYLHTGYLKKL